MFSASVTTVLFSLGVFATLRAVPQKEGFLGLYKGNGAMMVRIFPYGAIQFMAFDNYKKVATLMPLERCFCFCVNLVLFMDENIDLWFLW